jgi:uncharacterized protein
MQPVDRVLLIPRWAGRRDSDFYPWLARSLAKQGWRGDLDVIALRPPDAPELAPTVTAICTRLSTPARSARTLVLAHSVGVQAAMRALADLPPTIEVAALLAVAGWWSIDKPWPAIQPWIDTPFDHTRTRAAARRRVVLLSSNDPFTADAAATQRLFEDRLAADVRIHPNAAHFNAPEEPSVLAATLELLATPGA